MPNLLQQPPQPMQMGMQPQQQPPKPPSPQQVQDAHTHFSYMQKMLDDLIKLPDDKLNFEAILDSASEMIHENQLSNGKKGVNAKEIAIEMSSPNFPTADSSPDEIRQFLQNYFDKSVMTQAAVSAKYGKPMAAGQQPQQEQPQQPMQQQPMNNQLG